MGPITSRQPTHRSLPLEYAHNVDSSLEHVTEVMKKESAGEHARSVLMLRAVYVALSLALL
jgi:hypothetical protein